MATRKQLVGIVRAVYGEVDVPFTDDEIPPMDDIADPFDRLAHQARWAADKAGLPPSDSPLLRTLRDDERAIRGGQAPSLDVAKAWLQQIGFKPEHIERVAPAMLRLSAMNRHFLETHSLKPDERKDERRFLDFVESRCPDERYALIQEKLLNYRALLRLAARTKPGDFTLPEKYLYLPRFTHMKLRQAQELFLPVRKPVNLLDIGAGPGHFALASEFHGHHYWGIDVDFTFATPFSQYDLYGELFDAFGLSRSLQGITANTPLVLPRRFELVIAQMAVFSHHRSPTGPVPWQWPEWQFFLRDLVEHVLAPKFEVYLEINFKYITADIYDQLSALGANVDRQRSIIRITDGQASAIRG
jgi:hypothetical protein